VCNLSGTSLLHRDLIKTGRLDTLWGEFYDEIYAGRKEIDYEPLVVYKKEQVEALMGQAESFVNQIQSLFAEQHLTSIEPPSR
jgi:uncharacterized protein (UPF0332 family)